MERVRLDQHALQIQLAEQLPQHCPLMVFASGIASLADRQPQGSRVQRHLGNERRPASGGGLEGAPKRLAITDQLFEISCTTCGQGDRSVADRRAKRHHIHELEVAEG